MRAANISERRGARPRLRSGYRTRRWTREEYHRAADLGLFGADERLELIDGDIIEKRAPQKSSHFSTIEYSADALAAAFGAGHHVRRQGPIVVSPTSEPEPDIVVVAGDKSEYVGRHPRPDEVLLLVEVSDATLSLDRGRKAALYARAGIADYWIVNVNARTLEVRRDPVANATARTRRAYQTVTTLTEGETVSPLASPGAVVRVADLLSPPIPAQEA
jgi:Uma2 family endonuclease